MAESKAQADLNRLIIAIGIILVGVLGSAFLGIGIALSNSSLSFIGSLILSLMGTMILILERLIN